MTDNADAQRLPTPATVRAAGDRRRRRTSLGLVAGGAIVGSALVVALVSSNQPESQRPQPAEPGPSPTSTPGRETSAPLSGPHPIETGKHRFSARAVAAQDGRYVIVGDSSDFNAPGSPVYWSDDGVDWHAPAVGDRPESVNVTDVIAAPTGFLAVGVDRDGPAAWRSNDGRTWTESPVDADPGGGIDALWALTATRFGYYAWGFDGGQTHLWRSTNGTAWAQVADQSVFDLPQTETICAVQEVEGGLRAIGVQAPRGTREGHRVAWASSDGESWVLTEADGAPKIWCDSAAELGHHEAHTDAGLVRIDDPYGEANMVEVLPTDP